MEKQDVINFLCDRPAIRVTEFTKECGLCAPYFYLKTKMQPSKKMQVLAVMTKYGYRGY